MHHRIARGPLPHVVLTLLIALFAARTVGAQSAESQSAGSTMSLSPPAPEVEVKVSFLLVDLLRILDSEQSIEVDLVYRLEWRDERLAEPGTDVRWMDLDDIWHPGFDPASPRGASNLFGADAAVDAEGNVSFTQRVVGELGAPTQLTEFPLDEHTFRLSFLFTRTLGTKIIPVRGDLLLSTSTPTVPDWTLGEAGIDLSPTLLAEGFPLVATATYTIQAKRNRSFYLTKVIFPLMVIVMMSWTVFWAPPAQINVQFGFAATSILTVIAYRFALASQLPPVPYTTRLDSFLNGCFIMAFLALVEVVVTARLIYRDKTDTALKVDVFCRIVSPIALGLLAVYSFIL